MEKCCIVAQATDDKMGVACWIAKATDTYSEYVIFIAF